MKAQLQASLVSYEANKDLLQATQLQRFQALAERDKYMGMISALQQKLLEEEEVYSWNNNVNECRHCLNVGIAH